MMEIVGWLAASLVFASFFMRSLKNLRTVAIFSNLCFMSYALLGIEQGVFERVVPIFVLHTALLPLNIHRLRQVVATDRASQIQVPEACNE